MPWLEPVTLRGAHARLEPLSHDQRDGLTEAVRDGELWNLWYTFVPTPDRMAGTEVLWSLSTAIELLRRDYT